MILFISPKLTLAMLSFAAHNIHLFFPIRQKSKDLSRKTQDYLADSGTIVQETLQGIANVKAFGNEWFELGRFTRSMNDVIKTAIKNGRTQALYITLILTGIFTTIIAVVVYGTSLMQAGELSYGDLTAFVLYTAFYRYYAVQLCGFLQPDA